MMKKKLNIILLLAILTVVSGCRKEFLDAKPSTSISVPTTLSDLQMLLDNTQELNFTVGLGELSADDFYMDSDAWASQYYPFYKNAYVWAPDVFAGQGMIEDWNKAYQAVLATNVALEQLEKIERTASNSAAYDNIKAMALFMRSYRFFDLAQVFTLPYDKSTAASDMGIPLRLVADINAPTTRPTLQATYDQILSDALQAKSLATVSYVKNYFNRPSKASAYGFLSRIYMSMRDYQKAGLYADSALLIHGDLMDFNQVDKNARIPFTLFNDEILYQCYLVSNGPAFDLFRSEGYSIDTLLYRSYDTNDLRKSIYFTLNGKYVNKKGGYAGARISENSIATDELYLTRAECYARDGENEKALKDLNALLVKRYANGTYIPVSGLSGMALLNKILAERRKELVSHGIRWNDIRRLNKDGFNITLTRNLNGTLYTLPPNDKRYALPIPPDVIAFSGIKQNDR